MVQKKDQYKNKFYRPPKIGNTLSLLILIIIFVSLPVAVNLVHKFRLYKSRASEITYTNLIINPGFEDGNETSPSGWEFINSDENNTVTWVSSDVHSGNKAIRISAADPDLITNKKIGISSNWFKVTPGSLIETSAWWKAQDITWHKYGTYTGLFNIRIRLEIYDETKSNLIREINYGGQEGSIETWNKVAGHIIVPENAGYMRFQAWMFQATGTMWIDDVQVSETRSVPQADSTNVQIPAVIPQPLVMNTEGNHVQALGTIAVVDQFNEISVKDELSEYLSDLGKSAVYLKDGDPSLKKYTSVIRLGNVADQEIARQFKTKFRGRNFSDLGPEGYFFSVKKDNQNVIYLAANSEQGRFHAIQTLKQLMKTDSVAIADIYDKPSLDIRGIASPSQWWNLDRTKVVQGVAEVKYNYIWYQGGLLSGKLFASWRSAFTEADKTLMKSHNDLCKAHYISCFFSFGPRGITAPISYSSDSDINIIIDKMDVMYAQGIRNFGLNFDDLENTGENVLLVQQDVDKFNSDIGLAHRYFITEVFNRLKQKHGDINFGIVPMRYQRYGNITGKQKDYVRQLAYLPQEINIISSQYYDNDIAAHFELTNRKLIIWDNLYAVTYENKSEPQYVLPYFNPATWTDSRFNDKVSGIVLLPRTYKKEQSAGISWYSFADFTWAPERYNPNRSFQNILSF